MKKYLLVFRTERSSWKQTFLHASILFVVILLALLFYGNVYGRQVENYKQNDYLVNANISINNVEEMQNKLAKPEYTAYFLYSSESISVARKSVEHQNDSQGKEIISAYAPSYNEFFGLIGESVNQSRFSDSQVVMVSERLFYQMGLEIGDSISISDLSFQVIGIFVSGDPFENIIVPINMLSRISSDDFELDVFVNQDIGIKNYESAIREISSFATIMDYTNFDSETSSYFFMFKVTVAFLFVMASVNLSYIIVYIIKSRERRMAIYTFSGAQRRFVTKFIVLDLVATYTFSYVLAVFATYGVSGFVLSHLTNEHAFVLVPKDIILFYGILLAIYLVTILIVVLGRNKLNPTESYRSSL